MRTFPFFEVGNDGSHWYFSYVVQKWKDIDANNCIYSHHSPHYSHPAVVYIITSTFYRSLRTYVICAHPTKRLYTLFTLVRLSVCVLVRRSVKQKQPGNILQNYSNHRTKIPNIKLLLGQKQKQNNTGNWTLRPVSYW